MSHDEFESEPIPGLPELLPAGETLLWQGSPSTWAIARHTFHAGQVAVYFFVLVCLSVSLNVHSGAPAREVALAALRVALVGAVAIAVLGLLARAVARTTIYSITSRRVVMRFGVALPMTFNLPFTRIASADLKLYADRSGEVALMPLGEKRLGYVHLWPHVRGWRLRNPEPALRGLAEARKVADVLATAMRASVPASVVASALEPSRPTSSAGAQPQHGPLPSAAAAA